jgi:hypothetical protein
MENIVHLRESRREGRKAMQTLTRELAVQHKAAAALHHLIGHSTELLARMDLLARQKDQEARDLARVQQQALVAQICLDRHKAGQPSCGARCDHHPQRRTPGGGAHAHAR